MAGRGVDIKLDDEVPELGGLYVLGTERHEARRIDNQLRGRSGRQGDPGATRFYLSGQDQLVRLFAGDRIYNIMERFKLPDDQPMEAKILSNQIENAQKKVEEQNFVMRKNVLKYDDVMNTQRLVIYEQRRQVLEGARPKEKIVGWIDDVVERVVTSTARPRSATRSTSRASVRRWPTSTPRRPDHPGRAARRGVDVTSIEALVEEFRDDARETYEDKEAELGPELMRELERFILLQVVDQRWREHLENMDYLREGVHLRAMAQKDPLVEYRGEGHGCSSSWTAINEEVVMLLFHAQLEPEQGNEEQFAPLQPAPNGGQGGNGLHYEHQSLAGADAIAAAGSGEAVMPRRRRCSSA